MMSTDEMENIWLSNFLVREKKQNPIDVFSGSLTTILIALGFFSLKLHPEMDNLSCI